MIPDLKVRDWHLDGHLVGETGELEQITGGIE
jgi:hypothetical protein